MSEQESSDASKKYAGPRQRSKASISTGKHGVRKNFLDITALIRSIQRAEGNPDCFGKAQGYCGPMDCYWRPYCLENHQTDVEEVIQHEKNNDSK